MTETEEQYKRRVKFFEEGYKYDLMVADILRANGVPDVEVPELKIRRRNEDPASYATSVDIYAWGSKAIEVKNTFCPFNDVNDLIIAARMKKSGHFILNYGGSDNPRKGRIFGYNITKGRIDIPILYYSKETKTLVGVADDGTLREEVEINNSKYADSYWPAVIYDIPTHLLLDLPNWIAAMEGRPYKFYEEDDF